MQDPNIEENLYDYALVDYGESVVRFEDYSKCKKHKLSKREAYQLNSAYALNHILKRYIRVIQ